MTILLDQQSLDHADASTGQVLFSTFEENFEAALEDAKRNFLSDSARSAEREIVREQAARAKSLGFELPRDAEALRPRKLMAELEPERKRVERDAFGRPIRDLFPQARAATRSPTAQAARGDYDALIRETNRFLPEGEERFMSLSSVRAEALERAREARRKFEELQSRAQIGGEIGGFLGGVTQSFIDPINIFASIGAAPAAARGFLRAVLVEGGINLGAEAAIQTTVVPWLVEQGVPREKALGMAALNVVGATILGGLLGGGFNIGARATRKLISAAKRGKGDEFTDAALDAARRNEDVLPDEGADAIATVTEARQTETGSPYREKTIEAVGQHAENLQRSIDAVREGRIPDVANEAVFATKTAFVQPIEGQVQVTLKPIKVSEFLAQPAPAEKVKLVRGDETKTPDGIIREYLIQDSRGNSLANVDVRIRGTELRIEDITASPSRFTLERGAQQTVGPALIRAGLRAILRDNPKAKTITGERVSGIRFGGKPVKAGEGIELALRVPESPDVRPIARLIDIPKGADARQTTQVKFGTTLGDLMTAAPRATEEVIEATEKRATNIEGLADEVEQRILARDFGDEKIMENEAGKRLSVKEFLEESKDRDAGLQAVLDCLKDFT